MHPHHSSSPEEQQQPPLSAHASHSQHSSRRHHHHQGQQPEWTSTHSVQHAENRQQSQPWSLLSALSMSLYESMSFSRSPSFERTRYIVSTCTFIAIIYLRTLHCLFFGTGALSCAVLAQCLKHTIRQPRPERPESTDVEDIDSASVLAQPTLAPTSPVSLAMETSTPTTFAASTSKISPSTEPVVRVGSPTLLLAPTTTTFQKEQVEASSEPNTRLASQRIRRQRRRRINLRVNYGMPSSHAQLVAFFVCYISLQLVLMEPEGSPGQWFLILLLQLYAWSAVWSRIRLGRHSVSQVLVGAAIGALYGMVWFAIWSWKVEDMIKHWQWMDRYGVIQVRKIWRQLEMDEAMAVHQGGGRMYFKHDQGLPHNPHFLRV